MVGSLKEAVEGEGPWDDNMEMAVRSLLTPAHGLVMGYRLGDMEEWYHWRDPHYCKGKGEKQILEDIDGDKFE